MKKGILKKNIKKGVFWLTTITSIVLFSVFAQLSKEGNDKLNALLDEYNETKICNQLKTEEIELYTDAFKKGLIGEEELEENKNLINAYSGKELEKYIKMDREENKDFFSAWENQTDKNNSYKWGFIGSATGMAGATCGTLLMYLASNYENENGRDLRHSPEGETWVDADYDY